MFFKMLMYRYGSAVRTGERTWANAAGISGSAAGLQFKFLKITAVLMASRRRVGRHPIAARHVAPARPGRTIMLPLPALALQLSAVAGMASTPPSFCQAQPGWRLEWFDEFGGDKLDPAKWLPVVTPHNHDGVAQPRTSLPLRRSALGAKAGADCSGTGCILLGACRDAACVEDAAYVDAGTLVLESAAAATTADSERNFTTGAVSTWGKASWSTDDGTFRVCVSAMLPGAGPGPPSQGLWPAHWLMPHDNSCDPDEGEMGVQWNPSFIVLLFVDRATASVSPGRLPAGLGQCLGVVCRASALTGNVLKYFWLQTSWRWSTGRACTRLHVGVNVTDIEFAAEFRWRCSVLAAVISHQHVPADHWQTSFPNTNCSYPAGHQHQYAAAPLPDWNSVQADQDG
eukprot:SAG31_NODE_959_length_10757_cov_2.260086_4_plen_400_part_00